MSFHLCARYVLCRGVFGDGLGHSPDAEIFAVPVHYSLVQGTKRLGLVEAFPNEAGRNAIVQSPAKLLEVHRVHGDALLLRWNQYAIGHRFQRNERARLDIVVPPVGDKVLYELPSLGAKLHFVEYDEGFPWIESGVVLERETVEESVKIVRRIEDCIKRQGLRT